MPRIHDWTRTTWRNATQAAEEETDVLCVWENDNGDTVSYRYAREDADQRYALYYNDELVTDGDDEPKAAGSRDKIRKMANSFRKKLMPLEGDTDDVEFSDLQKKAGALGLYEQGDDTETLMQKLGIN